MSSCADVRRSSIRPLKYSSSSSLNGVFFWTSSCGETPSVPSAVESEWIGTDTRSDSMRSAFLAAIITESIIVKRRPNTAPRDGKIALNHALHSERNRLLTDGVRLRSEEHTSELHHVAI